MTSSPSGTGHFRSVVAAVEDRCDQEPTGPAIVEAGARWTFASLRRAVRRARTLLRTRRPAVGDRIGVALGRSRWQIVFALATWSEGLCYVPLDLSEPVARIRPICEDAGLRLVLTHADDAGVAMDVGAAVACDVLPVDRATGPAAFVGADGDHRGTDDGDPTHRPSPTDPAYVMYTSGSSGRPKGAVVTHGNLVSFMTAFAEALPETSTGPWLWETTPTFDISLLEMLWPLVNGQPVVLATPDRETSRASSVHYAFRQCTPSRARQLLHARRTGEEFGHWWVEPRMWLIGGELLPPALLRELRRVYPTTTFVNMYGPTEATIWSAYHVVTDDRTGDVPIGTALGNGSLTVLDRDGRPAQPGAVGEIVIAGDGVCAGYLNRPGLTAAAFGELSVNGRPARAYRTGDLGILGSDGLIRFRGRNDRQVKLLGHRIELDEIEKVMVEDPEVSEAVVVLHTHGAVDMLCAFVSGPPGRAVDRQALRRRLAKALPEVMVPGRIVVTALPRLPNGKLDRVGAARLCTDSTDGADSDSPTPQSRAGGAGSASAPAAGGSPGTTQAVLLEVMRELLGRDASPDDDFFLVGGNSLYGLLLISRARERGIEFNLDTLLTHRSASRMAAYVDARTMA